MYTQEILSTIAAHRIARDWTEYELALRSDLPQSTISSWYRKNAIPSIASLEKVCNAFGITISQLFATGNERVDLTDEQRDHLSRWSLLRDDQKKVLTDLMNAMLPPADASTLNHGVTVYMIERGNPKGRPAAESVLDGHKALETVFAEYEQTMKALSADQKAADDREGIYNCEWKISKKSFVGYASISSDIDGDRWEWRITRQTLYPNQQ